MSDHDDVVDELEAIAESLEELIRARDIRRYGHVRPKETPDEIRASTARLKQANDAVERRNAMRIVS